MTTVLDALPGDISEYRLGLRVWLEGNRSEGPAVALAIASDDRGFFRLPNVPAGHYTLRYETEAPSEAARWSWHDDGSQAVTSSRSLDLVGYETGPFLALALPGETPPPPDSRRAGTLEIELSARDGTATAGLPVELWGWTRRGFVRQRVLSGPDGFAAVDEIPAGLYRVRVVAPDGVRAGAQQVRLQAGGSRLVRIELRTKVRPPGKRHA